MLPFASDLNNGFYRIGTDNWAAAAAGAKVMEFHAGGEVSFGALQPRSKGQSIGADPTNVTGDGTMYSPIIADGEGFDIGSNYAAAGSIFTAPVAGEYAIHAYISCVQLSGHTGTILRCNTSNSSPYYFNDARSTDQSAIVLGGCRVMRMDASDTASIGIQISGGSKVIDLNSTSLWFSLVG